MKLSHSRIERFVNCPYSFKLHYLDEIRTIPPDNADCPFFVGQALHTGIEKGLVESEKEYFNNFNICDDEQINEIIKIQNIVPKAKLLLPPGGEYEVEIIDKDFTGFIDYVLPLNIVGEIEYYDIYDFKYSNNKKRYLESDQLHLYKYFFEKANPKKRIRNLFFLFASKVNIRQKKTEDLNQFRNRLQNELNFAEAEVIQVHYDFNKVIEFLLKAKNASEAVDYPKSIGYLCNYCEFKSFCDKGENYMLLPKCERRNIENVSKRVFWMYGSPFSGKTTFANKFDSPLMLNTDGNIKFVDAPYIAIKDQITTSGRMTNRKYAWEVFKETITELEKKQNDFKSIIVDLLEDLYEHCRVFMYHELGITHESDDSFRAWDKVRTEFLSTLKRLMNMDYENIILISHEDTSKDITKKGGDKITAIKPNLQEKAANKVAGMVDIVARVVADGSDRILSFKSNEVIFGGGRLPVVTNEISLDYDEFLQVYEQANKAAVKKMNENSKKATEPSKNATESVDMVAAEVCEGTTNESEIIEEPTRKRKVIKKHTEQIEAMECDDFDTGEEDTIQISSEEIEVKNSNEMETELEQEEKTEPVIRTRKRRIE